MGGYGLGAAMISASRFADSRGVFAGIVEIAIVGYVLIRAMSVMPAPPAGLAPGDGRTRLIAAIRLGLNGGLAPYPSLRQQL